MADDKRPITSIDLNAVLDPIEAAKYSPIGEFTESQTELAGFQREMNLTGRALAQAGERSLADVDVNYDFLKDIEGTEFEKYSDEFAFSPNASYSSKLKEQIREAEKRNRILEEGHWLDSLQGSIVGGILDPLNIIPVLGVTAKTSTAARVGLGAVETGAVVATQESLGTTVDVTKTQEEVIASSVGAAILGGALFGMFGRAGVLDTNKAIEESVDRIMRGIDEVEGASLNKKDIDNYQPQEFKFDNDLSVYDVKSNFLYDLVLKSVKELNPTINLVQSVSGKTKQLFHNLVSNNFSLKGEDVGKAKPISLEAVIAQDVSSASRISQEVSRTWQSVKHLNMSRDDFHLNLSKALRRDDSIGIKEIDNLAKKIRRDLDLRLSQLQKAGIIGEEFKGVKNAKSYLTRVWDFDLISNDIVGFDNMLRRSLAKQDPNLTTVEITKITNDIKKNILDPTTPAYRSLSYKSKASKTRVLELDDIDIENYLINDTDVILGKYYNDTARELAFMERFGSTDLQKQFDEIIEEFSEIEQGILKDTSLDTKQKNKKISKLLKERDGNIERLEAVRDLLLGRYVKGQSLTGLSRKVTDALLAINTTRLLGTSVIMQLADLSRMVGVVHLIRNKDAIQGLKGIAQSVEGLELNSKDLALLQEGVQDFNTSRAALISDIDTATHTNSFSRKIKKGVEIFFNLNLMTPMNEISRRMTVQHMARNIVEALNLKKQGKASKKQIQDLLKSGISEELGNDILTQINKHSVINKDGNIELNFDSWDSGAFEFMAILKKDVDTIILQPGIPDKPLWVHDTWARLMFQFKGFPAAAFTKALLPNLQDLIVKGGEPAAVAAARMMSGLMLGAVAYTLVSKAKHPNEKVDTSPERLAVEAMDRGGVFPLVMDINNITDRYGLGLASALGTQKASRFRNTDVIGLLAGPSGQLLNDSVKLGAAAANGEWSDKDTRALMRMAPGQNLLYWSWLVNETFK